ncbi:MAG: hypothetical protein Q9211_001114 [Gyalolechia sp. 1 TL-2023]
MAAYPVRQYPQSPSDPSLRFQEDQHGYPPQHNFHDSYQHDLPSNHPYREPPLGNNGGYSRTGNIGSAIGNPQWSARDTPRASPAPHPYTISADDGRIEQFPPRDRPGASYNEEARQYGASKPPPGNSRYQHQASGWGNPAPQLSSIQQRHFPPRDGYNTAGHSTGGYNNVGAPSGANVHHVPQRPHARDRTNGIDEYNSAGRQWPHHAQSQQRQNVKHKQGQGSQFPELPNQPRTAIPAIAKSKKPPKERILTSATSPESVSWDNPFPTFPSSKARGKHSREEDLNHSMAEMGFDRRVHPGQPESFRPATAAGRIDDISSPNGKQTNIREERPTNTDLRGARNNPPVLQATNGALHGAFGGPGVNQSPVNQSQQEQYSHSLDQPRPQMAYGRYSEDTTRIRPHGAPGAYQADDQRSWTMPTTFLATSDDLGSQRTYEKGPMVRGDRHELATYHEQRNLETNYLPDSGYVNHEPRTLHPGSYHSRQASIGDVFDSYYHSPHHSDSSFASGPREEHMPNFDIISGAAATDKRDMTLDDHLSCQQPAPALPPMPTKSQQGPSAKWDPGSRSADGVFRNKSSPNLQQQYVQDPQQYSDGFNFELPGSVPAMYSFSPPSSRDNGVENSHDEAPYRPPRDEWQQKSVVNRPQISAHYQVPLSRPSTSESHGRMPHSLSPEMRNQSPMPRRLPPHEHQSRELSKGPSPVNRIGPRPPPIGTTSNPDALPAHLAPVRAGLMQSPPSNQGPRPRPVRQYTNGSSSLQESSATPKAQISRAPREESKGAAVTYEELERLRQVSRSNPSDSMTQLLLAKKLVEAASVLADEGGRADPKTSNRNRERFISDAHKLVKKLAQNGYPEALFYLGDCHSWGSLGLQTDAKEAFACYQSAAKAGHAQAAYRVAVCCEIGLDEGGGTKRDAVKAMQWYERAATLGDTPAMYKMGVIQLKALLGQPKDVKAALTWLQRAAERANKENPHALHELALLYESPNGVDNTGKDEVKAKQLFTDAANLGYKFSQFRLGCAFEYGLLGCSIDPRQSIAWYSKAAVQDEHQSELALSGWYLTGSEGVLQQSDTEAYLWARKAAQAGLAKAEYAMGYFTEVGIGAPANIEDAKRWYWRSASRNFPKARERLEDLRRGGAKMQKTRVSRSKMNKQSEGECTVM